MENCLIDRALRINWGIAPIINRIGTACLWRIIWGINGVLRCLSPPGSTSNKFAVQRPQKIQVLAEEPPRNRPPSFLLSRGWGNRLGLGLGLALRDSMFGWIRFRSRVRGFKCLHIWRVDKERKDKSLGKELICRSKRIKRLRYREVESEILGVGLGPADDESPRGRGSRVHLNEGAFIRRVKGGSQGIASAPCWWFQVHKPPVGEALKGERLWSFFHFVALHLRMMIWPAKWRWNKMAMKDVKNSMQKWWNRSTECNGQPALYICIYIYI